MLNHYLLTLYRSLTRHRLYAALNVLGLAVGIAVFLVLMLDVRFETRFDRWIPDAANIYRLDQTFTFPGRAAEQSASVSGVIAPLLKADYPQIAAITRLVGDDEVMTVGRGIDTETVFFVDRDFPRVLDLPLARGDWVTAMAAAGDIVISERIARKYFGSTDVIGRRLTLSANGVSTGYAVAAVLRDLPADTHLKLDIITPLTPAFEGANSGEFQNWGRLGGYTYVRFRSPADAGAVRADLLNFETRRATGDDQTKMGPHPTQLIKLGLTPLTQIHFKDAAMSYTFQPGVDARIVTSLEVVGLLTLAIATLNYVNLATARSALRAREVAVRKVLGATRAVLIAQFLVESVVVTLVAVLIGVSLAEMALPLVNASGGSALKLTYWGPDGVLAPLGGLTLLVGLVAGGYPALLLSGFQPAPVRAASRMPGGGRLGGQVRTGLVLLQFAAAIGFTVCTFVLSAQAKHLHDADRGFRRDGLILIDSMGSDDLAARQGAIVTALRATPGVTDVTISNQEPASANIGLTGVSRPGARGPASTLLFESIGDDYLRTYGATLVAGRTLDRQHRLDDIAGLDRKARAARGMNVMLNQMAVKTLGFASPAEAVGKTIRVGDTVFATVVGVVGDVRLLSPRAPINAEFYSYRSHDVPQGIAAVRYQGVAADEMMSRLRAAWKGVVVDHPFAAKTAEGRLSDYYVPDEQRARLFTMGAALAVAIACVGLYGLASFTTARRVKEIGIRKTLGASTTDILRLLIGQFLRPVLLANLVAWPLAWWAMRSWLSGFDQRITLSPGYFLAATLLTLIIAVGTVAGQAFAVARAEPAKALRHE